MPIYDFKCRAGHEFDREVAYAALERVRCACGKRAKVIWKKAPATDVRGAETHDTVLDVRYTSRRELERKMKERGFEPAGDRIGGARSLESLYSAKADRSHIQTKRMGRVKVRRPTEAGKRAYVPGTA